MVARSGEVHADQVSHVLRHVELSETVLTDVQQVFSGAGIAIDDKLDHDDEDDHDDTPVGVRRELVVENDADEKLLSRRRQRRTKKRGPKAEGGSADAVRMYLREIGQVDLLTVDDERRLAQLIEEGKIAAEKIDAANEAGTTLDGVEDRMLMRAVKRGERAKSELTQANLRLVVSIAKRYSGSRHAAARSRAGGQPRADASRREVRLHEGLQVLDLRHVVDPSGDHPLDRRPGPHDPDPGAHGRAHEPGDPCEAHDAPGARA